MPSQSLVGLTTNTGWTVKSLLNSPLGSGGNFCVRYLAESADGEIGFLKAMDLSQVIGNIKMLQETVNTYVFEQDILNVCKDKKLSRVVTPLDAGELIVPNFPQPLNVVYYVIFEKAEGTLREKHLESTKPRWLPAFRALHHVTLGIEQLHSAGIAHQDIKPSNVLAFESDEYKVSDLGRVVDTAGKSPFKNSHYPGDHSYKPTEMFFGIVSLEFIDRRSCDMHMVGSLTYHLIAGVPINMAIITEAALLDSDIRQKHYKEALPFLLAAFNTILKRYKERCDIQFGDKLANSLFDVVFEMCHPDVSKRGSQKLLSKAGRLSMRRYVGKFASVVKLATITGIK